MDNVNHPAHYKVGGIETIDFIEAKGLNYNLGNVVKYVTRAGHKQDRLEDLRKAKWYLEREIGTGFVVEPIPAAPVAVPVVPVVVQTKPSKKYRHRYPYNCLLTVGTGRRKLRDGTLTKSLFETAKQLLAAGPARRQELSDTLSTVHKKHAHDVSKYLTNLLDYGLLKVVS